jgi:hypothetical protein
MTDEFTIESKTVQVVRVRNIPHSHHYVFTIREREGQRLLEAGPFFGNTKASMPALTLLGAARAFAEREAREAALID